MGAFGFPVGGDYLIFPSLSTASTAESIRDRIIAVIEALTPESFAGDKFRRYRNEGAGRFEDWADDNPQAALRRFQVRDTGEDTPPAVSNTDIEQREVTFSILVAYPQNARAGKDQALDRDDLMSLDQHQIEKAVGMQGRANFTSPYPDACWLSGSTARTVGAACDFLEIRQVMTFMKQQR